ncbi:Transcriptional regulator of ribosomal biogenesis proteins [Tieghemiomyces parasiticus]|uniref:Transcriptional regulator of ribosomal biogenesis proteins n=1 Tax=Tieghemiomyces parasiticus TaxID=78921 RepID=A0A9W8E202_9FUNG|nr:Transcriptional regulator of ribosomal biogenesis proteins [Tieghemiomyces parasiticus]
MSTQVSSLSAVHKDALTVPLDMFDLVTPVATAPAAALASPAGSSSPLASPTADADFFYPRELETTFCRDFSCCGLVLEDLHDLLQHYEECHVRLESDVRLEGSLFDDDWTSSSDSDPSAHPSPFLKATQVSTKAPAASSTLFPEGLLPSFSDDLSLAAFDAAMLKAATAMSLPVTAAPSAANTAPASPSKLAPVGLSATAPVSPVITPKSKSRKRAAPDSARGPRPAKKLAGARSGASTPRAAGSDSESGAEPATPREKPYRCPVEGCGKSYKNPNGLKYHNLHGHTSTVDGEATPRPFTCNFDSCDKAYKNLNGLKYHMQHTHKAEGSVPATAECSPALTPVALP